MNGCAHIIPKEDIATLLIFCPFHLPFSYGSFFFVTHSYRTTNIGVFPVNTLNSLSKASAHLFHREEIGPIGVAS